MSVAERKLAGARGLLEQVLVLIGAPPVVLSPEAMALYDRITEGWPSGEEIDLYGGYGFMRFQQRTRINDDLHMNERQIRRELRELVDAGLLQGDPMRAVWWLDEDEEGDED